MAAAAAAAASNWLRWECLGEAAWLLLALREAADGRRARAHVPDALLVHGEAAAGGGGGGGCGGSVVVTSGIFKPLLLSESRHGLLSLSVAYASHFCGGKHWHLPAAVMAATKGTAGRPPTPLA